MSVKASAGKLGKVTKQLMVGWAETKNSWRDTKAREFEEKFIAPLPTAVESATKVMMELDKLLTRIRRDCE